MPKLWNETVDAHRAAVRDAIVRTTADLVAERGPASVTMSQIAEAVGIGRATLYKYFPDVDAILVDWHARHVADHLEQLGAVRDEGGSPAEQLAAVLTAYGFIAFHRGRKNAEVAAVVHRGEPVARARQQLLDLFRDVLAAAAAEGRVRDDVAAEELAAYCLHALDAAGALPSPDAVHRLVAVTLTGLRGSV
ncbi:TetR/AcrR family transcriptional regulator [Actinacidiphila bryophytorum]|uniref:TetR/AcrR family transcriptional regulator n=1 Tax=Actinacidiphila bryophytorum TaxID=1436133 RepID=UPI002176B6D5|nr:TetR/AcrR family transcriptional regulator [Actinacidiphila bryophytorum]UWE13250.1 TetR/AcrR family transcriptional regulator [Actinacidiphila bryophytorum]